MKVMKLADELNKKRRKAFDNWIDEFAEELKPKLKDAAENGYKGFLMRVNDRDDFQFFKNDRFLESLEKRLGGCRVSLDRKKKKMLLTEWVYTEVYLDIEWGESGE